MILASLFEKRASLIGGSHPSSPSAWLTSGADTFAGVNVTPDNALGVAAIFAAVRCGSETTAVLSIDLFKRLDGGGKKVERDHGASWVMREQPNADTSPFIFRETMQGFVETWGNAFAEIEFVGGQPARLIQRRPDRVLETFRGESGKLFYRVDPPDGGPSRDVPAWKMLHIPAFGGSGIWGLSPVTTLRETVGRNMAHGRYRSAFFGEGLHLGGVIEHPGDLNPEGKEEILSALADVHKLPHNAFRAAVLDEGMSWKELGFPNDSAQMIETGIYELQDVCRAWRFPPHKLMELSHGTFTNIEHLQIDFQQDSILPRTQRWVGELNRKLLTETERRSGLFLEMNLDTLLRGDFETRQAGFSAAVGSARMTPNEARAMDNMNPIEGGDATYVPLNWREVGALAPEPKSVTERTLPDGTREVETRFATFGVGESFSPGGVGQPFAVPEGRATVRDLPLLSQRSAESRWRLRDIFEDLLVTAANRIVTAEVNAIRKEIAKLPTQGVAQFRVWLEGFFERHAAFTTDVASPVLLAMFEAMSAEALDEVGGDAEAFRADLEVLHAEYSEQFGNKSAAISQAEIDKVLREANVEGTDPDEVLGTMLDRWTDNRALDMAVSTATDGMGAVSMAAYTFAGVTVLRWIWQGGDCKICPHMHGKVVSIGTSFTTKGERIGDPDVVTPLLVKQIRRYPGLHKHCKCTVGPG